jgi:two-component system sensor histidine kinase BaeS
VRPLDRNAVNSLASEAARLARLVEDLHTLSLSDLGALSYHKEPVDLSEIVAEALEPLANKEFRLETDLQEGAMILGDGDRLAQVFGNLLQNTLRYTDAPGRLSVSVRKYRQKVVVDWADSSPRGRLAQPGSRWHRPRARHRARHRGSPWRYSCRWREPTGRAAHGVDLSRNLEWLSAS